MEKIVSSQDAPERFGALLQGVSDKGDRYVIEQDGVPLAVVIPFALYSRWAGRREDFFADIGDCRAGERDRTRRHPTHR